MHCTVKKTLEQIVAQQNDYLVCVKANQGRLYQWIESQWQTSLPCSVYQEQEQSHGRIVESAVFACLTAWENLLKNGQDCNDALASNAEGSEMEKHLPSGSTTLVVWQRQRLSSRR